MWEISLAYRTLFSKDGTLGVREQKGLPSNSSPYIWRFRVLRDIVLTSTSKSFLRAHHAMPVWVGEILSPPPNLKGGDGGRRKKKLFLQKKGGRREGENLYISPYRGEKEEESEDITLAAVVGLGGQEKPYPQKRRKKTSKVAPAPPAHLPLPVLGFWRGEGLLGAAIMSRGGGGWGHHDIMEREEKGEKRRKRRMLSFLGKKIPTRRFS